MRWISLFSLFLLCLLLPVAVLAQESDEVGVEEDSAETTDEPVYHTIVAGDNLFSIAVQYDTTIPELERLNNLNTDTILHIGQELIISGVIPLPIGADVIDAPDLLQVVGLPDVPKMHLVQGGENISTIAEQYALNPQTIVDANQLTDETVLQAGQLLKMPGLQGNIIARDYMVGFGDTFEGIAAQFNTRPELLLVDDTLFNPQNLIVGQTLRLVSRTGSAEPNTLYGTPHVVKANETLVSIAAHHNLSPRVLATANQLNYPTHVVPGQRLRVPNDAVYQELSAELTTLQISSEPLRQGEAFTLYIESAETITPTGSIRFTDVISTPIQPWFYTEYEQTFPFAPYADGYIAIVGLNSFVYPGLYEVTLSLDGDDAPDFVQRVEVIGISYGFQAIDVADNTAVRSAENAMLTPIYSTFSLTATFPITETFISPLDASYLSAVYGAARSYAGAPVSIFHTGVDFGAPISTPIYAVADGVVVFNEFTELRGNVVILDHGLGIKTGYFHLSQTLVQTGDVVSKGTAIAALGNTGLSTGPHLHWDVRVRDVPINGQQWLSEPILPFAIEE